MMKSSVKYEMMYQSRKLSSQIIMEAMNGQTITNKVNYLKGLKKSHFDRAYYDKEKKSIYSEIGEFNTFDKEFYIQDGCCYTVLEDPSEHLGVRYIVLKESNLSRQIQALRMKIIGYLILSFISMGIVGYFLARLFLAPVRHKIESLDRFISDTTHELNTPITAILMTIKTLKLSEPKKLRRLEASAKRLSSMYSSLTYSLQNENKKQDNERLDFATLVQERVEFIDELIISKRLRTDLHLEPLLVIMNKESAIRLIDNLLSNAIKYSNPNGTITLSTKNRELRVEDEGIGIDLKAQKDIFKRYNRANDERGGFGIGLDIVLSICKQYKITIELESKLGEGSRFILKFPS